LVVVVDSSQPVAPAADYLYATLKSTISNGTDSTPSILIACHKSDHAKAKNARRIKLQLRSELIRLGKLDNGDQKEMDSPINWEETMNAVPLCSSTVSDLKQLRNFCETGTPPSSSKKR
jgi:signal recognition particle receptor subunit beta